MASEETDRQEKPERETRPAPEKEQKPDHFNRTQSRTQDRSDDWGGGNQRGGSFGGFNWGGGRER